VVRFRVLDTVLDAPSQTVITAGEILGQITEGRLSVELPAGFTYAVKECVPGGRSYEVSIPAGATGELALANLGPALPPAPETDVPGYLHTQSTAATVWSIAHNLNTRSVSVIAYDATWNEFSAVTTIVNPNLVTLHVSPAQSGFAVVTT
jgi:hypothetical protein